jgi:uncharacterized protein YjdB
VAANTITQVVVLLGPETQPPPNLQSLQVTPASPSIVVGTTQQFVATGTYSNNSTTDVTALVTWNVDASGFATITAAGLATGMMPGLASVNATLAGVTSNTAALQVTAVPMVSLQVTQPTASLSPGQTRQFKATGVFGNNTTQDVTLLAAWSSDALAIATIGPGGLATAVDVGTADITASFGGLVSNTAVLTVTPTPLASITISPNGASMTPGTTQAFTATGNYTDGSTRDLTQSATWSSDAADVAIISGAGLVTGVAPGKANVSASLTTMASSSVVVTVLPTPLASITVTPPGATIAAGTTQRYTAMATYVDNSTLNVTASVSWGSSNTGVATIGASGVATGVVPGNVTIAATLGGVTSSPVSLTVTQATVTGISVTPQSASILRCARQQYTATATLSDASSQDLTSIASWISSATGVATVSSSGRATGVTAGSANITASYGGVTSNAAGLTVTAPGNSKESEERRHCDNDDDDDDGHGDGDHGDH